MNRNNTCGWCGAARSTTRPLLLCASCFGAGYCNRQCMRHATNSHRQACKKLVAYMRGARAV